MSSRSTRGRLNSWSEDRRLPSTSAGCLLKGCSAVTSTSSSRDVARALRRNSQFQLFMPPTLRETSGTRFHRPRSDASRSQVCEPPRQPLAANQDVSRQQCPMPSAPTSAACVSAAPRRPDTTSPLTGRRRISRLRRFDRPRRTRTSSGSPGMIHVGCCRAFGLRGRRNQCVPPTSRRLAASAVDSTPTLPAS